MALKGSSQVENGTGRLPCLTWLRRSSSTAASTTPSRTRQAAGSWNAALIPSVYMQSSSGGLDFADQLAGGGGDGLRGHPAQAVVVPLRADALVAVLAGHVVEEHAAGDGPGRVLRVGQGVQVHHGRADRGRDVGRPGVVANQQRGQR